MRIVLLGDMHLYTLAIWPWRLLSKRVLGQANLWLRRQFRFDRKRWAALIDHARALSPDLVLGSGDLTTTALPHEFELAMDTLRPLVDAAGDVFVVPGNHDRYTYASMRNRVFESHLGDWTASDWPHYRQLTDGLHLIGLDPTRATMLTATGRLGVSQLDRLRVTLAEIDPSHRLVVVCHYPIGTPPGRALEHKQHRLIDQAEMIRVLADAGHDTLYVHGHMHEVWCFRMPADAAPNVTALNAGAPVMHGRDWPRGQGFWQIDTNLDTAGLHTDNDATSWFTLTHHAMDESGNWRGTEVAAPTTPGEIARVIG